ncbi:hypothetical protein A2291_01735 [candidate division WOR-1 bacterium RIFOXYB2_FULL_42_35]|uniref:HEPN domain-containing protein n=1 Tax=candidate division WOR-1 bacterium RIFOXYC2_FULL_41_25 TaxID=1802586 RepID=A0A1F4TQ74_UNCSA|nr:MAG: hypothetical protein A2247_03535 [candidate division WOR-1 bacterium RIFOXYA2_FULL_41_14]OGC25466.1 MAG: hypothetical protein A2291_01735 [candidate division WOR-1 bacterium RIFOXYB2_FULL_42_35]OGC34872.1 MAG: hypothetical protein A2462_05670 [candidate division WOR-1 bacterium RIFOXYC2_FULL_41_25]OGC42126.1 MAG: hypothetical protein A2548_01965 [candidate division WOR-1 bacterium RIFOXYD2_FULL_41_8]
MDKETKSLIKAYIEKAQEKLKTAAGLVKDGSYDDAVSRAYYSAFHAASALLLTEGLATETHRGLLNIFGLHFVKTGKIDKKFARFLSNLKDDREAGDYEAFSTIDKQVAEKALGEATEFLKEIEKILARYLN